jgi:lipid-A-disaccharide synthase
VASNGPAQSLSIFISTGELSGEMHGAHLAAAIQRLRIEQGREPAHIAGNGSRRMAEQGIELLYDVATWGEMGIFANLLKAQYFLRAVSTTARYILLNEPELVILVDSRFMNLSLARYLRRRGYAGKIAYYVAPVRWQSLYDPAEDRRSLTNRRFTDIRDYCDFAIPIYPISLGVYEQLGIPHEYVGHPLCELARPRLSDAEFSELTGIAYASDNPPLIIGALPGSRVGELRQIAPEIFRALALMKEGVREDPALPPLHAVAVLAHEDLLGVVTSAARRARLADLTLIGSEHVYDLMARARLMIAKSGTGVHECMLMEVPAIMCYRVAAFSAWLARWLLRFAMPYYSLPNLLANRPILPELIQDECNHRRIAELAGTLLYEAGERRAMLDSFAELRQAVCKPAPLRRAAELVLGLVE